MSKPVPSYRPFRLEITGTLCLETLHVGSGKVFSLVSDSPILCGADHRPYLPGSSLRGVLRAHLEREAAWLGGEIPILFGNAPKRGEESTSQLGRLTVADATPAEQTATTEVRDHVRLDERHGAAAKGAKFDQEVATGRFSLRFCMVYEGESAKEPELALVGEAVRALKAGELSCGAKSGCGYGRLTLKSEAFLAFDRGDPGALSSWLNHRLSHNHATSASFEFPPATPAPPRDTAQSAWSWLECRLLLQFDGPVLVRASLPPLPSGHPFDAKQRTEDQAKGAETADHVFVRTGPGGRHYLPGASFRGVLRHQAIRICTTLAHSKDLDRLFGTIQGQTGQKGLIEVADGMMIEKPESIYLDHVAIDRITGFAADKKKFSTCGLQSPAFETTIRVRFTRADLGAVALMGFLLRDSLDGWLWCGSGVTRGFGHIHSASRILSATLDVTDDFQPPAHIPGAEPRVVRSGHTRFQMGAIGFEGLNWLWSKAETAWRKGSAA